MSKDDDKKKKKSHTEKYGSLYVILCFVYRCFVFCFETGDFCVLTFVF